MCETSGKRKLYIVLSRSGTVLARAIQVVTRKYYNHTSVSFDKSLDTFYSFGRRNPRLMFPAGFIIEGVHRGFFGIHPHTKICVLEGEITREDYRLIQQRLAPFIAQPRKYKYGVAHLPLMIRGMPYRSENNYVCSVFAAYLLRNILNFEKDYSLVYPEDFYKFNFKKIYEGEAGDYDYE